MVEWFSHHYALAIAVSVLGAGIGLLGIIYFLAFLAGARHRGLMVTWAGLVLCFGSLAVPGLRGAMLADEREDQAIRAAVLAKYAVAVDKWGSYRHRHGTELTSLWKINGENVTCTMPGMDKPSDPVLLVCGGRELPRAA